ncbi:hypothetical protein K5549_012076 [Capra hircus]|nr:hypothetical protein K5549_012076 [Capra hircus]
MNVTNTNSRDLLADSQIWKSWKDVQWFKLYSGFLKFLPGAHRQVYKNLQEVNAFIDHSVEKIRETLDPNVPPYFHPPPPRFHRLLPALLGYSGIQERQWGEKSNPNSKCHERNLIITALSLFFPGPETTSTTLRYGFLFTLIYLHIAERIHKEIDQVIGSYRPPALDDRAQMPHTDAVIYEIQRFADLIPICVSHMVTKDALFRGCGKQGIAAVLEFLIVVASLVADHEL